MAGMSPWGSNPWGQSNGGSNWWLPPGTGDDIVLGDDPQAAYQRFLGGTGRGGGSTPSDRWYQQQFGRMHNTYLGMTPDQPAGYRFLDFLRDYGGQLGTQYAGLSARQRGENPGAYQSRLKWVM